jgi:hypothetical protein
VAPEVRLREVEPADLRVLFDHQRDPQAVAMADVPPRDVEAFRTHWDALLRDRAVVTRTILADGEVAGHALSFERNGRRLVGYWLGREHCRPARSTRRWPSTTWRRDACWRRPASGSAAVRPAASCCDSAEAKAVRGLSRG